MKQHENAIALVDSLKDCNRELNEATTRSRIIDTILYEVLSWPKNAVTVEEHNQEGYSDYILKDQNKQNILIIEAKKEGAYFNTPKTKRNNNHSSLIKIKTLITDKTIKNAINQVRKYCLETGTVYGCVTNGHVWIYFTAFSSKWVDLNGFVIEDLNYFSHNFTNAYKTFGYENIVKHTSLKKFFQNKFDKAKLTYTIKERITSYFVAVDLNVYAQYITKPVKYYFSDFDEKDKDFLDNCYVDERLYSNTKNTLRTLLIDNATPYLENKGIINYEREKLSKKLSTKIENFIEYSDNKHIVVIYGDRGCGKSTFIKKLIYSDIPEYIHNKLNIVYIDLLNYAAIEGDKRILKNRIWKNVIEQIDPDNLRNDYKIVQETLFPNEFKVFKEQLSCLYSVDSEIYGTRLEHKINDLLKDLEKLSIELAKYLRLNKKHEIVLILDNTDQFSADIQDFCFQIVSEIYSTINCLSIITIREERFFRSKNLGVLDAFETTQYHIASPQADKVFLQRLNYLIDSLKDEGFFKNLIKNHEIPERNKNIVTNDNFIKYLKVFEDDFYKKSNLYTFLVSCAQKDMRKALELFRELIVSGYMNIYEIINIDNIFTLQIHQVLKPLMTPKKYFYDEEGSSVPNIFRLRDTEYGSHFTSIRILKYLNRDSKNYYSLSVMKSDFLTIFDMKEDFNKNLKALIEHKLIEANIKVDTYIPEIEKIIITPFGQYFIEKLIHFFTYLDLICTDCNFYDKATANYMVLSANEEYKLFSDGKRGYRMIHRVKKTNHFIDYLLNQEKMEIEDYSLDKDYIVMDELRKKYYKDIVKLKNSSLKQTYSTKKEEEELKKYFDMLII